MSWYFFGGFSAYLIEPSGRCLNHCGMLADPGMIGRRLERDVERDLQAEVRGGGDEAIEVVERAEPRLDRRVAAGLRSDRPRAARIAGRRVSALLRPLRCVRPIG